MAPRRAIWYWVWGLGVWFCWLNVTQKAHIKVTSPRIFFVITKGTFDTIWHARHAWLWNVVPNSLKKIECAHSFKKVLIDFYASSLLSFYFYFLLSYFLITSYSQFLIVIFTVVVFFNYNFQIILCIFFIVIVSCFIMRAIGLSICCLALPF